MRPILLLVACLAILSAAQQEVIFTVNVGANPVSVTVTAIQPEVLRFTVQSPISSWIGFGFPNPANPQMIGSDAIIGRFVNNVAVVADYWLGAKSADETRCPNAVCPDTNDVQNGQFLRIGGGSVLVFERNRNTLESGSGTLDRPIALAGQDQDFIIALGTSDVLGYHSSNYYIGRFKVPTYEQPCNYGQWTNWDDCSATCGTGSQTRTRTESTGGSSCTATSETQQCNTQACPAPCTYDEWTNWNQCSKSCGTGSQSRVKRILTGSCSDITENQDCNTQSCPPVCTYDDWTNWQTCTVSCGSGTQTRSRQSSVSGCPAQSESRSCNTHSCQEAVVCKYFDWGIWDSCTVPCGGGTQSRVRGVLSGGTTCTNTRDVRTCNTQACTGVCPHKQSGLTRWSTWGSRPTSAGTTVTIPAGTKVLLDVSPGFVIGDIIIHGQLIIDGEQPIKLEARKILVQNGGHFIAGTAECKLTNKVEIVMWGTKVTSEPSLSLANKVLGGFDGAKIDIHGTPHLPVWTVLADHANVGDTKIVVNAAVQWTVGEVFVIASTDFTRRDENLPNAPETWRNYLQDEVRTITKVEVSGQTSTVHFSEPLLYTHYGKTWNTPDNQHSIDMRAEVGLLTRNILFRGDTTEGTTLADRWGGHIMITGPNSEMRIQGVELTAAGQANNMARYPIHFHECRDQPNSYVKQNSIHDTFQRAVTIHITNKLLVEENVAYNINGHAFFIEDGVETGNILIKNLAIRANPHTLLVADKRPAMFWITNPNNHWERNVAVGGAFGYWFALPKYPMGLAVQYFTAAERAAYLIRNMPLGSFVSNKAHSSTRNGLHIDDGLTTDNGNTEMTDYIPIPWQNFINQSTAVTWVKEKFAWRENKLLDAIAALEPGTANFVDFTAYKCIEFGVWGRGQGIRVVGAKLADNQIGAQFPGSRNMFEDGVIVGETDNFGNPSDNVNEQGRARFYNWDVSRRIVGYRNYDAGSPDMVKNTVFYNFQNFKFLFNRNLRKSGAISSQGGQHVLPTKNRYYNLKFVNVQNHVLFEDPNQPDEPALVGAALIDVDGSITGECGSEIVYGKSPILSRPGCKNYPDWNALVCSPGSSPHRQLYIEDLDNTYFTGPAETVKSRSFGKLYRLPDLVSFSMASYTSDYQDATKPNWTRYRKYYTVNAIVNTAYFIKYGDQGETPARIRIIRQDGAENEWFRLAIPYPVGTTFTFESTKTQVSSLSELNTTTYYIDSSNSAGIVLWLEIRYTDIKYSYQYGYLAPDLWNEHKITAACPGGSCKNSLGPESVVNTLYVPPVISKTNLCEKDDGNLLGGIASYTQTGTPYVVFNGALTTGWTTCCEATLVTIVDGLIRLTITPKQRSLNFIRSNPNTVLPADNYTHLTFKIRKAAGAPYLDMEVAAMTKSWVAIGKPVNLRNPIVNPNHPIKDEFVQVYVPLDKLGLRESNNIIQFRITNTNYDWPDNIVLEIKDVMYASFESSVVKTPYDTSRVNTNFNYDSSRLPPLYPNTNPMVCPQNPPVALSYAIATAPNVITIKEQPDNTLPAWVAPTIAILAVAVMALFVAVIVLVIRKTKYIESV